MKKQLAGRCDCLSNLFAKLVKLVSKKEVWEFTPAKTDASKPAKQQIQDLLQAGRGHYIEIDLNTALIAIRAHFAGKDQKEEYMFHYFGGRLYNDTENATTGINANFAVNVHAAGCSLSSNQVKTIKKMLRAGGQDTSIHSFHTHPGSLAPTVDELVAMTVKEAGGDPTKISAKARAICLPDAKRDAGRNNFMLHQPSAGDIKAQLEQEKECKKAGVTPPVTLIIGPKKVIEITLTNTVRRKDPDALQNWLQNATHALFQTNVGLDEFVRRLGDITKDVYVVKEVDPQQKRAPVRHQPRAAVTRGARS